MTAKPHNLGVAGTRAGIPLARAQRLAAKRGSVRTTRSRAPLVFMGTAALSLIVFASPSLDLDPTFQSAWAELTAVVETSAILPMPDAPPPALALSASTSLDSAPSDLVLQTPASDTPGADFAALPHLVPACIDTIEETLRALHGSSSSPQNLDDTVLPDLIEGALGCRQAGVVIDGSIELVSMSLADLWVRWDPDTQDLRLDIVHSNAEESRPTTYSETGVPTDFRIRTKKDVSWTN